MTIKPVSGEITSQKLNDNFSYLDSEIKLINSKMEKTRFRDLEEPIYIAHRGSANIFPENTLEAYRGSLDLGFNVIEQDVRRLSDGGLAVMHDSTMDRTTNRSGLVENFTTMGFKNATVDILQGWNANPPLFTEVLKEFGTNAIYVPEIKDSSVAEDVVNVIQNYQLQEYCLIQSSNMEDLSYAIDYGIPVLFLTDSVSPSYIKSQNIDYVGVSTNATEEYIQDCINTGLKVIVYTVNYRYQHDYYLNLGVSGFFTDDPIWITRKSPIKKMDTFGEQVFTHGQIAPPRNLEYYNGGKRGEFITPDQFGWPMPDTTDYLNDFCLQGWAGELPNSFTISAKMILQNSVNESYWGSIAFCTQKDIWNDTNESTLSEGYHVLLRESGSLQLYRRDGNTVTLLNEISTPAWNQGETANIEIVVNTSDITVKRDANSFTVNDTTYRNGYLHLGRRVSGVLFEDIYIS